MIPKTKLISFTIVNLSILLAASCSNYDKKEQIEEYSSFNSKNDCDFVSYLTGSPNDIKTNTDSGFVLMGGGKDVDHAFRWMIKKSGGGDFVVLRASGEDGYNNYIYSELGGVNSVNTIMIDSKEKAECPKIAEKIRNAEAVFIAGGDQSKYYSFWKGTQTEKAIDYLANVKKVPIGGTSAGLAILGELLYTAENGSVDSTQSLKNPYDQEITIKKDFLSFPLMKNIITDTHFAQRERQGRIITFMARAITDGLANVDYLKGIAVDESTAYVLEKDGKGQVFGNNNAWFFKPTNKPESCVINKPLNWSKNKSAINTYVVKGSENGKNTFNINNWTPSGSFSNINYYVEDGILKQNTK